MAIIAFWSDEDKETAQTMSMVALSTYMAIEHNYKILLLSTNYNDDTLEGCFWEKPKPKKSLIQFAPPGAVAEFDNGIEGLAKTIKANKATPANINNNRFFIF